MQKKEWFETMTNYFPRWRTVFLFKTSWNSLVFILLRYVIMLIVVKYDIHRLTILGTDSVMLSHNFWEVGGPWSLKKIQVGMSFFGVLLNFPLSLVWILSKQTFRRIFFQTFFRKVLLNWSHFSVFGKFVNVIPPSLFGSFQIPVQLDLDQNSKLKLFTKTSNKNKNKNKIVL